MNPSEIAEVLRRARARIEQPEHWCRDFLARDAEGSACLPRSDAAVAWCAYGAVQAEARLLAREHAWEYLDGCADGGDTPVFNDAPSITHADILALYDCAIAKAEGRD